MTDRPVGTEDARERALAAYHKRYYDHALTIGTIEDFCAGYDAARAEYERKVAELEQRVENQAQLILDRTSDAMADFDRAEKAEARARELQADADGFEERIGKLSAYNDRISADAARTEAALATAEARVREIDALLTASDEQCKRLILELRAAEARLEEQTRYTKGAQRQRAEAESALATAREQKAALRATVERVRALTVGSFRGQPATLRMVDTDEILSALDSAPATDAGPDPKADAQPTAKGLSNALGPVAQNADHTGPAVAETRMPRVPWEYQLGPASPVVCSCPRCGEDMVSTAEYQRLRDEIAALRASPPAAPRAECTVDERRIEMEARSVLEACLEYKRSLDRDLWSRSLDVCQQLVAKCVVYATDELARRAAKKGTEHKPERENFGTCEACGTKLNPWIAAGCPKCDHEDK